MFRTEHLNMFLPIKISFRAAYGGHGDRRGMRSANFFRDGNIRWPCLNLCVTCEWNLFGGVKLHVLTKSDYFCGFKKA